MAAHEMSNHTGSTMNSLGRAKEFAEATIQLPIEEVLEFARMTKSIGRSASILTARSTARYDRRSQGTLRGAYDDIHQLMRPSIRTVGIDETIDIFNQPATRRTISFLAGMTTNADMENIVGSYAKGGDALAVTDDGLVLTETFTPPEYNTIDTPGCPFANSHLFDSLTDRVIDTYAEAYRSGMPYGWLDRVNRIVIGEPS